MGLFVEADKIGEHFFSQVIQQERGAPIKAGAAHRADEPSSISVCRAASYAGYWKRLIVCRYEISEHSPDCSRSSFARPPQ
jgi:hypothetical protein